MTDPVETPVVEVVPEKVIEKEPEKTPEIKPDIKIDSRIPLSRQIEKMIQATPERKDESEKDPEKKEEPPKATEEPDATGAPGEGDENKKPAESESDDEPELKEPVDLPPVAKYILDNLPQIQVIGHQGDEGKDKVFKVKLIEELPDDFEFSTKRAELIFNQAIAAQEANARELMAKYRQEENSNKLLEIQNQEALDVEADVKQLQKEKILGKFPATDDPEFNNDPAVKEANEIYALFQKTNAAYAQANRTYRISYRDAADKYYVAKARQTPKEPDKVPEKESEKVDKPKTEREKVAEKVGAPSGTESDKQRPRLPRGSTQRDVLKLYRAGRI